jgi:uncharacterized membrane protein YhhN
MTPHIPAIVCLTCTAVLIWADLKNRFGLAVVSKSLAAGSFIAYAVEMGALNAGKPGAWVMIALILSAIGDLCLLSKKQSPFLAGIVAFLLGHVAYIIAFLSLGVHWLGAGIATVPIAFLSAQIWQRLAPHTGTLRPAVAAYIMVISGMVTMAVGSVVMEASPGRIALLIAATGFFLSDLCVAQERFVAPGPRNKIIGSPLYFGSQLVFAGSIATAVG